MFSVIFSQPPNIINLYGLKNLGPKHINLNSLGLIKVKIPVKFSIV